MKSRLLLEGLLKQNSWTPILFQIFAFQTNKKFALKCFIRYIDDIFFIWQGEVQELNEFIDFINQQHPSIKFVPTFNTETKSIPFLDMNICINKDGIIETSLYKKETTKIQYLLPSSCHPGHVTKNIPYSLCYRLLRLCSNKENFDSITRQQQWS